MLKSETYRAGFSLLELLIVLFVIGMVIMLLLPAARKSKEEADAIQCIGNLKHIGISLVNCSDTNKGLMPPVLGPYPDDSAFGTIFYHILPYMQQEDVYNQSFDGKNASNWNTECMQSAYSLLSALLITQPRKKSFIKVGWQQ